MNWTLNCASRKEDNFVAISGNLKEIDYSAIFQKVDATLANVKMITEKLNSKDNTIGLLFNDPALYNNLNATTENAASLLEDLKAHPKRYVHFSLFGKKDKYNLCKSLSTDRNNIPVQTGTGNIKELK